ncbi:hypothetical protein EDD21DRAFT_388832 [Dissophora ornata]|nr:hypothetical protein EDD21DRAFT_388832 [Dissophora ornata]
MINIARASRYFNPGSNMICEWVGNSPGCGTTPSQLGATEVVDGETWMLVDWTKGKDAYHFSGDCRSEYGEGCWSGYKRLWCRCNRHVKEEYCRLGLPDGC